MNKVEIVVARYEEDMSWVNNEMFDGYKITCYNKGNTEIDCKRCNNIIKLDNIASCEYAYFYHIVNNYDNLADLTVFLIGSCMEDRFEQYKKIIKTTKLLVMINNGLNDTILIADNVYDSIQKDVYSFMMDSWSGSNELNIKGKNNDYTLIPAEIRPFGEWYKAKFGDLITTHECYGNNFVASKTDIHNRPKSFYEDLLNELSIHKSSNLEVSHYIERSWEAILKPKKTSLFVNQQIRLVRRPQIL
jgi:hypothetical protein